MNRYFNLLLPICADILQLKICNPKKITLLKGGEGVDLKHFGYTDNSSDDITFLFIGRDTLQQSFSVYDVPFEPSHIQSLLVYL